MKLLLLVFFVFAEALNPNWDVLNDYYQSNLIVTQAFYQKQLEITKESFSFSPASIQAILAIVALSGEGQTQNELIKVTYLPCNTSKITEIYSKLSQKLLFDLSNLFSTFTVYIGNNVTLNSAYKTLLQSVFSAYIDTPFDPFVVQTLTYSVLKLSSGITFQHHLVLDVTWKTKFNDAQPLLFHVTNNVAETIHMLHVNETLNYHYNDVLQAEFLEIPIIDNELTLTIVLPNEMNGLTKVEKYISEVLSAQTYQKLNVSVTIPKFWGPNFLYLDSSLRAFGVYTPFSLNANFTSISDGNLTIIDGTQKTFINLTKATSEIQQPSGIFFGSEEKNNVDRPFIYYIKPRVTKAISEIQQTSGISVNPQGHELPNAPEKEIIVDRPFMYYIKHSVMGVVVIGRFVNP